MEFIISKSILRHLVEKELTHGKINRYLSFTANLVAVLCIISSHHTVVSFHTRCWSSRNALVSGAEGLRFQSRAGQIGHSVANGSPPLRHFFERSCVARAQ